MTVNIELLERILNGIESGKLEHDQRKYYCGTAKCIAGWVLHFSDYELSEKFRKAYENDLLYEWPEKDIEEIAAGYLGINNEEANLLFNSESTIYLQEIVLKAFKEGRRLDSDEVFPYKLFSCGNSIQICYRKENHVLLINRFLGNYDKNLIKIK